MINCARDDHDDHPRRQGRGLFHLQQEDERPADHDLIDERIEIAAQRAGEALLAGDIAVEPIGKGGEREDRACTVDPHVMFPMRTNRIMPSTSRPAVS